MIGESTLGRDIIGGLPDAESACVRDALGEEAFEQLLDSPVSTGGGFQAFPFDCIGPETRGRITAALIGADAGGLTSESESCLAALYASNPGAASFGLQAAPGNSPEAFTLFIDTLLCLTDEEAEALMSGVGGESGFPAPSDLRCIIDSLGTENYVALMTGVGSLFEGQPSEEMVQLLARAFEAFEACGVAPITPGLPQ